MRILRFLLFIFPVASFAAPFEQWFDGTSPQGVPVRVWGCGDEYSVRYEAEDGHAVVKDAATRKYFYARQETDGALVSTGIAVGDETDADRVVLAAIPLHLIDTSVAAREERQKRIDRDESEIDRAARWTKQKETMRRLREAKETGLLMAPPDIPTSGTVKGLTVLIDFPIAGSTETTWSSVHPGVTVAQLDQLLNGENCALYGNASSVRSYYLDVSNGRLDYSMVVIGPIVAPKPRTYYDDPERDNGDCARELMGDVFKIIKADADFSTKYLPLFQSLSTADGYVRSLNFWFAGESAEEWNYGLWAHKWYVSDTFASTYSFAVGGKTVKFDTYQITPILKSPGIYTFCHENGHMLCGFPDLYNYEESIKGNRGVGYFSLMYGSSNKLNPPFIDPYLRAAAGWVEPQILPSAGGTVTVRNNHTDVWKYENPSNPLEYYLIENRQQTGRDASISAGGILIWRCNEAGSNTHPKPVAELSGFGTGVHRWPYELSLEQADGKYDLEQNVNTGDTYDAWYSGNEKSSGKFNDNSLPTAKWANAGNSGLSLSGFSSKGDTMTFTVASYSGATTIVPLADALDATELVFSTSAKYGWFGQTAKVNYGDSAAKSGAIGNSQSTWMQTTVTGPGTLSFAWMVSSEKGYDYLEFAIDGQVQQEISGSQSWTTKTHSIPEGLHVVSWTYRKDYSSESGDDAGYVDHVVWKPAAKVAKPVISGPSGADYLPPATVSVSCATTGATIRYTLDGSDPTETSAVYVEPIAIEGDVEIRVRAFKDGFAPSAITSAAYFAKRNPNAIFGSEGIEWTNDTEIPWREEGARTMRAGGLDGTTAYVSTLEAKVKGRGKLKFAYKIVSSSYRNTATFKADGTTLVTTSSAGTVEDEIVHEVKSSAGATIIWTLTVNSPTFDYDDRGIWLYDVVWDPADKVATPVIDGPSASLFDGPVDVSVSCATAGATLRYTLDGSDPTETSPVIEGGKVALAAAATLKVRAFKVGLGGSSVATARYLEKAEPGEWLDDADRARLSAAVDGNLILFVRADCANSLWTSFAKAVDTRTFRNWAEENGVYLVLRDDSDASCPAGLVAWWTKLGGRGTTTTTGALIPQFYLIDPVNGDKALASAYALNGYNVGSVKFGKTAPSLISGIISLLDGKDVELTSCPTDNAAAVLQTSDITWINDSDVPWTEVYPDGQMRTGGLMNKKYTSTLTARVKGPGTLRFAYRVCSYSDNNPASYSLNGTVKKKIGKTGVSYASEEVALEVGTGTNEISWSYSVAETNLDYTSGYTSGSKSAWCGMWLYDVSWEPRPEPEPGVWTTDAERVRLSAAVDGRMICIAKLNENLEKWAIVGPILNNEQFLSWAAANGVYLLKWDSKADSSGTSESAKWYKTLYAQSGKTANVNWEMCFALPADPDTFCGYARAYDSYYIGTVKYDKTVAGMIAGFASILSANGLTPIAPEIVDVVALLDWEKGTPGYEAAVEKITAIAAGANPAVDLQTLRDWIGKWQLGSSALAASDYVVASAFLDTQWPITEEADVAFADVAKSSADGFSFMIELRPNADESPEELTLVKEFIAGCIQTTGDLGEGFSQTVDSGRVTIGDDGRVTITPDPAKTSEFFKIVIPRDPQ